jgi:hypothetical protein
VSRTKSPHSRISGMAGNNSAPARAKSAAAFARMPMPAEGKTSGIADGGRIGTAGVRNADFGGFKTAVSRRTRSDITLSTLTLSRVSSFQVSSMSNDLRLET